MLPNLSFLQRILVILQLIFAGTLAFSIFGAPFFGQAFEKKAKTALFSYVLEEKRDLFLNLDQKTQSELLKNLETHRQNLPFPSSFSLTKHPTIEWLWIFASFFLGVALLKEKRFAKPATLFLVLFAALLVKAENSNSLQSPSGAAHFSNPSNLFALAVNHLTEKEPPSSPLPMLLLYWSAFFAFAQVAFTPSPEPSLSYASPR